MADTIRQHIIDDIKDRMESILTPGGYDTDAGQNVFEWREYPVNDDELPCIIIRDKDCPVNQDTNFSHENRLEIEFGIKASSSEEVRQIFGDIYTAIGTDLTWNGFAYDTEPVGEDIQMEHESKIVADASLKIIICFRTQKWDPYSLAY